MMFSRKFAKCLLIATATFGTPVAWLSSEAAPDDMAMMMSSKGMDKNGDGMVSRQEFLDMMAKAFDMKAKEMKVTKVGMTEAQLKEFLTSLYSGG